MDHRCSSRWWPRCPCRNCLLCPPRPFAKGRYPREVSASAGTRRSTCSEASSSRGSQAREVWCYRIRADVAGSSSSRWRPPAGSSACSSRSNARHRSFNAYCHSRQRSACSLWCSFNAYFHSGIDACPTAGSSGSTRSGVRSAHSASAGPAGVQASSRAGLDAGTHSGTLSNRGWCPVIHCGSNPRTGRCASCVRRARAAGCCCSPGYRAKR